MHLADEQNCESLYYMKNLHFQQMIDAMNADRLKMDWEVFHYTRI